MAGWHRLDGLFSLHILDEQLLFEFSTGQLRYDLLESSKFFLRFGLDDRLLVLFTGLIRLFQGTLGNRILIAFNFLFVSGFLLSRLDVSQILVLDGHSEGGLVIHYRPRLLRHGNIGVSSSGVTKEPGFMASARMFCS